MSWSIVSDSSIDMRSADFTNKEIKFITVPLKIVIGDKEYIDDESPDINNLLSDMKASKKASSSACPSPEMFAEAFRQSDNTICISMTSGLSGTYNSACIARDMVKEEFPEKNIYVIDTKATAGVMVLAVRMAEKLIEAGDNFKAICEKLDEYVKTLHITFTLSCFDNLVKAGRMSSFAGLLATKLGIHAVAKNSSEGKIEVIKKTRGEDRAMDSIVEFMGETKDMKDLPVVISHCNNETGAKKLADLIKTRLLTSDITILTCKALTTFYAMEKGLLIGF